MKKLPPAGLARPLRWVCPALALILAACASPRPPHATVFLPVAAAPAAIYHYPLLSLDPTGWVSQARIEPSPNHGPRSSVHPVSLLVLHNISLPPGQYGGEDIIRLFTNRLTPEETLYDPSLARLRVSAHFLIRRDGQLVQFVSTGRRAMHAGNSHWNGQGNVNDRSIGIELEGSNHDPYEDAQYATLAALTRTLEKAYPIAEVVGHSDIAPERKSDPGPFFDWQRYSLLAGIPRPAGGRQVANEAVPEGA